jgi:Tfp pilus assembly protein PilW
MKTVHSHSKEAGFSLVEITMAAALTIMLVGGIAYMLSQNQRIFVTEYGVTDMNQNLRTAVDLLTRDIQSAGAGFPRGTSVSARGNFAAIFYTNGANGAPDSILIINGDPFAPSADVDSRAAGSAEFFLNRPADVYVNGNGANAVFTYGGPDGTTYPIYRDFTTDPRQYIVYDDNHAMIFQVTSDAQQSFELSEPA